MSIVAGAAATLWGGAQASSIDNHRRRLLRTLCQKPQHLAQIMRHGFKAAGLDPTLRLLVHAGPWGQIIGNHPPGTARPYHIAHRIEHGAHGIFTLRSVLFHQHQIGCTKRPLFIAYIARIIAPLVSCFMCHPKRNAWLYVKSTDLSAIKFMTRSRDVSTGLDM